MKINVGVFFGGTSVEHEVSIISANQAMHALDKEKYQVIPIYLTKDNEMYTGKKLFNIENYSDLNMLKRKCTKVNLVKFNNKYILKQEKLSFRKTQYIDIAFPIVHGTGGEDGTLQGFFELLGIPYIGCDIKGAVVGQDKVYMKMLFQQNDIPTANFISFNSSEYLNDIDSIIEKTSKLNYPLFVKPSSLGSSVGISRATTKKELIDAIEEAISFDTRIIVEEGVNNLIEINCSVIGDYEHQETSEIEEVMGDDEFLSFKDKYLSNQSSKGGSKGMAATNRIIPARISEDMVREVEETAKKVFRLLNTSGVCRIDFLIDKSTQQLYVNEINTIPGSLAFYLWESKDVNFTELTDKLIQLGIKREREKEKLTFTYESNILSNFNGAKGSKLK